MLRFVRAAGLALVSTAAAAQTPTLSPADSVRLTVDSALPLRTVREAAALAPAFRRDLATGTLVFRSRTGGLGGVQEPVFVVDGVRRLGGPLGASTLSLLGASPAPFAAVTRVEALGAFVPATTGEAGGGIVVVETEAGAARAGGRVEGLASDLTDAYGARLASATLRAPFGRVGGVSVTGEWTHRADAVPSAGRSLRLSDDAYALLQQTPQLVTITDPTGATRSVPFPVEAAAAAYAAGRSFTEADVRTALGLAPGTAIGPLRNALPDAALADAERVRAQDDPLRELAVTGQAVLALPGRCRLRAGGALGQREMTATGVTPAQAFGRRLANRDALSRQADRRAAAWLSLDALTLPGGLVASARASAEATGSTLHPAAFSDAIEDALGYGDIDASPVAQRYSVFRANAFGPLYTQDGGARPSARPVTGFALPGAAASVYDRQSATSVQLAGSLARAFGAHRVEVGGESEVQTFRRFTLNGYTLAAFVADADGGQGVAGYPNGVTRYDQFDAETLRSFVETYGYTFNGLDTADAEDVDAYAARTSTDVAPFRPLTAAGYVRDAFTLGPLAVDAGLRVEHYDARALTLFDPFAVRPILRAGSLPDAPAGIGADFAVYQNGSQTVGYRDREGRFYDAAGTAASADAILSERRGSVVETNAPLSEAFARTEAVTRVQPRLRVSAAVTPTVRVSGHVQRLSRRPDPALFVPFTAYLDATGGNAIGGSAALRPEDVRTAGLGVEVEARPGLTLGAEAFARQTRDVATRRAFTGGLPAYQGVTSDGRRDEAGVDLTLRQARTHGVAVEAGYTFAVARDVTASDAPGTLVGDGLPAAGDTRHALDLAVDARVPAGNGALSGFGAGLIVAAQSGLPYTALQINTGFSVFDAFTPDPFGPPNGARLPWTSQVDLRVDRVVGLGAARLTAFVWVENVLGTRNTLAVYRATGAPDSDGFPTTAVGQTILAAPGDRALYEAYTGGPVTVGGRQSTSAPFVYGAPRQVRLGLVIGG